MGYSANGVDGPYRLAITMNGEIVANFITTGILNADLITSGVLKSQINNFYLNMENGYFKLGNMIHDEQGFRVMVGDKTIEEMFDSVESQNISGINLVSNLTKSWELGGLLRFTGGLYDDSRVLRTKFFYKHNAGNLIISFAKSKGFTVKIYLYDNTKTFKERHEIDGEVGELKLEDVIEGYFKVTFERKRYTNLELLVFTNLQLSEKTMGELSGSLNIEELFIKVENSDKRTPYIPSNKDALSQRDYYKTQLEITKQGIESTVTKNELTTQLGLFSNLMELKFYEGKGNLVGNIYSFTKDDFKIGGGTGNVAEHTPDHSKWTHADGTYSQASNSGLMYYENSTGRKYHHLAKSVFFSIGPHEVRWIPIGVEFSRILDYRNLTYTISTSTSSIREPIDLTVNLAMREQVIGSQTYGDGSINVPRMRNGQWEIPVVGWRTTVNLDTKTISYLGTGGYVTVIA